MQKLFRRVEKIAGTEATVLLTGESGTGKELAARALHTLSHRAGGPFVAVNCAAIPEGILETELFGAERGAYTGAHRDRVGKSRPLREEPFSSTKLVNSPWLPQRNFYGSFRRGRSRELEETKNSRLTSA